MSAHAAIHIGLKQLDIDEDDRRAMYMRVTGKNSLTKMSWQEHQKVLAELGRLGFTKNNPKTNAKTGGRKKLTGKYAPKLQALWIAAWNLGIVDNKNDEALIAFVKRQTKVDHVRFVRHAEDASKVIEALKSWMAREAGVDWKYNKRYSAIMMQSGYRIAAAQWYFLNKEKEVSTYKGFGIYAKKLAGISDINAFKEANWIPVMNALGIKIRERK